MTAVFNPIRWATPDCPILLDDTGRPEFVPYHTVVDALVDACKAWREVSGLNFHFAGAGSNDILRLPYSYIGWGRLKDDSLAECLQLGSESDGVTGFSIVIDGNKSVWAGVDPGRLPYFLTLILVHEMGHALGLDHSEDPASVMHARARSITITEEDRQSCPKYHDKI